MAAIIDVDQLSSVRRRAVLLFATAGGARPTEAIPGSFVADLDGDFSDPTHPLPNTVPVDPARVFEAYGVSDTTPVVVYDDSGTPLAPRVWWLARVAGLRNVAVLDGGLEAWRAADRPLAEPKSVDDATPGEITAAPSWELLTDADGVREALALGDRHVVDVRPAARFAGTEPEPRENVRAGHMPGAVNLPFTEFRTADGRYRDVDEMRDLLETVLGPAGAATFVCGSGVTACVGALAATLAGYGDVEVYEGSWTEWGHVDNDPAEFPAVTGDGGEDLDGRA
ncbi:sulfurtransferase [Corynebacterium frankenforstense]|uniref:sulfurtransferase n=1 Tax=Corynebacterium frankenforstense TaxID=1230998 RepID=UPI00254FD888|nr:rhodanese-like domain-containing protein [Corynebacterium frankenforstense]MDK6260566.1 rhodanese-like domain-containing protein [Corynebacterium frankenforstense]